MNLYRQEKLIEKLLKFRWKKHNFDLIKVECYDRYEGDTYNCRVEVFKGGRSIKHRLMKHEASLDEKFVVEVEKRLQNLFVSE